MDMTIDCPHCGTPLRVPESAAGRRGRCTECDQRFIIPSMEELLDATVSHFMVATISAADEAEEAFEDAVAAPEFQTAQAEPEGTVAGVPVVSNARSQDTASPVITTDSIGDTSEAESHDDADLIDITSDIQHSELVEDAFNDTPLPTALDDSGMAAGESPKRYPQKLLPADPRPYLVVRSVSLEGVRVAFEARWLKNEVFRTSMPMRCAFSGDDDAKTLLARAVIFLNRYDGPETPLHSLETRHELHVSINPSPRGMVRSIGRLDGFNEPYDLPLLYYTAPGSSSNSIAATAETLSDNTTSCEVLIPHHRTAIEWVERVNGRCGHEYTLLKMDIARYASDAWRRLPDQVRQRVSIWCRFERGETFKLYLNDPDFTTTDAGLAGVVVTDRRLIYHKFRRSRSVSLNQDALLHISTDAKIARLTLQSMGRAARCGKIHKADLSQLIDALSDAPKLRVEVRKSQTTLN